MLATNRAGEQGPVPDRRDRLFMEGRHWYFRTREGTDIGPYKTKNDALTGLHDFIEFMQLAEPPLLSSFYASLQEKSANDG